MQINPAEFKLLVVDDVQTNVLLLKALLGKEGYGILVANNGQEALEVIRNENTDLILLDVMMPGMDGFEVAERLKSEEFRCEIPIIFLTALDDTQSIVNGFKLGVGDFISKPFRKEELMVRIKHQLSLVAARRIIEEKNEELRKTIAGRDKMYSVIAHDLRSPMASMKMLLNTIMMSVEKDKIDPDIFDMLVDMNYRGIVLEAFGVGGMHFVRRNLLPKLRMLTQNGISVVACSQCLYESSDFSIYEVGQRLLDCGVIPARDMTTEAVVTKLMWALGQTEDPAEVRTIFDTNYSGEVTLSLPPE